MKLLTNAVAILLLVVGLIWALQGANVISGSFMSGGSEWLYIGIGLSIGCGGVLWWVNRRDKRRTRP